MPSFSAAELDAHMQSDPTEPSHTMIVVYSPKIWCCFISDLSFLRRQMMRSESFHSFPIYNILASRIFLIIYNIVEISCILTFDKLERSKVGSLSIQIFHMLVCTVQLVNQKQYFQQPGQRRYCSHPVFSESKDLDWTFFAHL